MKLVDTHSHLNFPEFRKDLGEVIERAKGEGILKCLVVGIDVKSAIKALELKKAYPDFIEVAFGFHPHEVKKITEEDYQWLEENLPQAVALGEIGLDWVKEYSPKEVQIYHLERQLELAKRFQKPVILHLRGDSSFWREALALLKPYSDLSFLFHCFTSDWEIAKKLLDFQSFLSIPGVVTFEKAKDLQLAVKRLPLERLLLETDSPYLAPVPMRGKRNEPAFLKYTAQKIAELKDLSLEEVSEMTTHKALEFFKISL